MGRQDYVKMARRQGDYISESICDKCCRLQSVIQEFSGGMKLATKIPGYWPGHLPLEQCIVPPKNFPISNHAELPESSRADPNYYNTSIYLGGFLNQLHQTAKYLQQPPSPEQ